MRVAHVTTALVTGGAQSMLAKLIEAGRDSHQELVVSLVPGGGLRDRVAAAGASVRDLGLAPGRVSAAALWHLARLLREWRPDVIHGWMYHGNLAALLGARVTSTRVPVIWNIRHSLHDLQLEKRATRFAIRIGSPLARLASAVVFNSAVSATQHTSLGYRCRTVAVIPNGFDAARFRPNLSAREQLRAECRVDPDTFVIGHVARHHPMKDHHTLFRAAAALKDRGINVKILLAGEGITPDNRSLQLQIRSAGLAASAVLLGERADMPDVMAALDVLVLCSAWGEGFPNVIGEAMAVGIPCVATDVGDCRSLLGGIGSVVPPGDVDALVKSLAELASLSAEQRSVIGLASRERIVRDYALPAIARRYHSLYRGLADGN